ncbi:MAG: type III polyketide synthase [Bacteroidota bacterium]|nr:type III polyketide synthase [Bacteroidota bacterium]
MTEIISIATALPEHCHPQMEILSFMQDAYGLDETDRRKLKFLYKHSGIEKRYSVIADYGRSSADWTFIPQEKENSFPTLEQRMERYDQSAATLSVQAIEKCIEPHIAKEAITHLITVSCTGMRAPGLDLEILSALQLRPDIFRTSLNFMGCYAAIHALKLARMICESTPASNVVIVCTEFCTLHFQQAFTEDNAASSLLFADGSAAILVSNQLKTKHSLSLRGFYSHVVQKGKDDMSWKLSSQGFLMTLSSYVPQLIQEDILSLVSEAVRQNQLDLSDITHWCIHPGGKRILDMVQNKLHLDQADLAYSRKVLSDYGNMSSPTVLFVLKEIMEALQEKSARILGMAFGPGLTMETFIAERS